MNTKFPTIESVKEAYNRIKDSIRKTPVLTSSRLDQRTGAEIYFKCENFQRGGSFKVRGASNALAKLTDVERSKGVATHSSGNHAQGIAIAAKQWQVPAYIVMPEGTVSVKAEAVKGYGANVIFSGNALGEREKTLQEVVDRTGAIPIHPYNRFDIIEGQGTVALELFAQIGELDVVIVPVGGGGLGSGTAIVTKALYPNTRIILAEPELADDAFHSLKLGKLQPPRDPVSIADGLRAGLGELTFSVLKEFVDDVMLVSEEEIAESLFLIMERMKIVIEPSSALPYAALTKNKNSFKGKKIGIVFSGGNIDFSNISKLLDLAGKN